MSARTRASAHCTILCQLMATSCLAQSHEMAPHAHVQPIELAPPPPPRAPLGARQNIELSGDDHAPVTRGRMRAQSPLPHGPGGGVIPISPSHI